MFYLVWLPSRGEPTHVHKTLEEAKTEALRLATKHQTEAFVLTSLGCYGPVTPKIEWREATNERTSRTNPTTEPIA